MFDKVCSDSFANRGLNRKLTTITQWFSYERNEYSFAIKATLALSMRLSMLLALRVLCSKLLNSACRYSWAVNFLYLFHLFRWISQRLIDPLNKLAVLATGHIEQNGWCMSLFNFKQRLLFGIESGAVKDSLSRVFVLVEHVLPSNPVHCWLIKIWKHLTHLQYLHNDNDKTNRYQAVLLTGFS